MGASLTQQTQGSFNPPLCTSTGFFPHGTLMDTIQPLTNEEKEEEFGTERLYGLSKEEATYSSSISICYYIVTLATCTLCRSYET